MQDERAKEEQVRIIYFLLFKNIDKNRLKIGNLLLLNVSVLTLF